jgi:hypothetical protein
VPSVLENTVLRILKKAQSRKLVSKGAVYALTHQHLMILLVIKTGKEKSCTWITKNKGKAAKRIAKYCTDTVYDGAVKANCADSYGLLCPI